MKTTTQSFGRFFNFRLFLEGLKRLRVVTTALGIIALVASALVPIVTWIDRMTFMPIDSVDYIDEITTEVVCLPAMCMVALAPIFFFVIFSFLHKRKQSDFFHAIPYTRTCVYVSFVTAALVSVFAIQILSAVVAGVLWSMVPYAVYDVGGYCLLILCDMLAAAMLASFMMLALTVSGTPGSCTILFFLFASLVRIVLAVMTALLEGIVVMDGNYMWDESPLSPLWFYPLSAMGAPFMHEDQLSSFVYNPVNILYSVFVTLLLFAIGWILYKYRHSEMAGNPAPGKKTQTLFRVLFATPLAVFFAATLIDDCDESVVLVILVGAVLCYFLYELITTKRAKNMLKAIPTLWIVALICVVFAISYYGVESIVRTEEIEAEDIQYISMDGDRLFSEYGGLDVEKLVIDDPDALALLAERYAIAQGEDTRYRYEVLGRSFSAVIQLKNGGVRHRRIYLTDQNRADLISCLLENESYTDTIFQVPEYQKVHHVSADFLISSQGLFYPSISLYDPDGIWASFYKEWNKLSREEKSRVLFYGDISQGISLYISGQSESGIYAERQYFITTDMPQTRAKILQDLIQKSEDQWENAITKSKEAETFQYWYLGIRCTDESGGYECEYGDRGEMLTDVLEFLDERHMTQFDVDDLNDPDTYYIYVYGDMADEIFCVATLTETDLVALSEIIESEIVIK